MKKLLIALSFSLLLILTACSGTRGGEELKPFAQCVTDAGVKMFGAYWCPACADQKEEFGSAWENINYVECSLPNRAGQTAICRAENIVSYPTWDFGDGERETGSMPLSELASRTACSLPV